MFEFPVRSIVAAQILLTALAGLTVSCGSGGSSGSVAPISFEFASATTSTSEGSGAATVGIRLVLTIDELLEDATVEISDSGAGSASAGSDYSPFDPQLITFEAGLTNGAMKTIVLTSLGDSAFEGTETIDLRLSNPSTGSGLGGTSSITVEISESESSSLEFQVAGASSVDEASAPVSIAVELTLQPGVMLERELTVQVADTATGTATAYVDYTALAQTLTFPAGSTNGAIQEAQLAVLQDIAMEPNETVVLELRNPSLNATLGGNSTFTYTITNDDASASQYFAASALGLGPLTNGQAVNLGTQALGTGPNGGLGMTVANQGGQAMTLFTPNLSGANPNDFSVEASISQIAPAAATAAPTVLASPMASMFEHPTEGVELALDSSLLLPLRDSTEVVLSGFPLPGGASCDLELRRVRTPWSGDAVVFKNGAPTSENPSALCEDLSIWKGAIAGEPGSSAFLSFSSHGCRGWLRHSDAPEDIVHLVTDFDDSGPEPMTRARLVHPVQMIAAGANQTSPTSVCGGAITPPGQEESASTLLSAATTAGLTLSDCRLAVETDYQFYQRFGSDAATMAYVTQLFAAVSDVYFRDIQTTLSVAYLGIYDNSSDPWSIPDVAGSTADMLNEFRTAWIGNWPVQADLAHFMSGAGLGGGIAYVNVLCNNSFGYGVSASLNGNIDWGSWTGQSSFINWDFVVVAHEIGHNFSAAHTHNYCPPIDQCNEGNCNGARICSRGTIMSYCHTCAGGLSNIDIEFHPLIANQMRGAVNASCLGAASLASGESLDYQVRFRPTSSLGSKNAYLNISHSAPNVGSPFQLHLSGTAVQ